MKKSRKKEIERELHKIYENDDGRIPNLQKIERAREHRIRRFLIALVIFFAALAATSWAGFFIFGRQFQGSGVEVAIEAPEEIVGGEAVTVKIQYRNQERNAFGSARLDVTLPREFQVTKTNPETPKIGIWEIGSVGAGDGGTVEITGKIIGKVGSAVNLQAVFVYRPAGFNAEFEKVATKSIAISDFVLDGSIIGPDKIVGGEEATYTITIFNKSEFPQENVMVKFRLPQSFILSELPKELSVEKTMPIAALAVGDKQEITLRGAYASGVSGSQDIGMFLGVVNAENKFLEGREVTFTTDVVASDLELRISVNEEGENIFAHFGDTLNASLYFKNKGNEELKNITLALELSGFPEEGGKTPISVGTITSERGGKRDGGTVTWTKKQIPELGSLSPGEEGSVNVQFEIINQPFTTTSRDYRIEMHGEATVGAIGDVETKTRITSNVLVVPIVSDTALRAEGYYYNPDGIVLGTGPLPPKVGETTTYRIFWKLENTLHEIGNIEVGALLGEGVAFTGRTNIGAGDLRYDAESRKVVWTLNRMPLSVAHLETSFEVGFTPTEAMRGTTPQLLGPSTLTAKDSQNGGIIAITSPDPITTALPDDEFARGKGKVQ